MSEFTPRQWVRRVTPVDERALLAFVVATQEPAAEVRSLARDAAARGQAAPAPQHRICVYAAP